MVSRLSRNLTASAPCRLAQLEARQARKSPCKSGHFTADVALNAILHIIYLFVLSLCNPLTAQPRGAKTLLLSCRLSLRWCMVQEWNASCLLGMAGLTPPAVEYLKQCTRGWANYDLQGFTATLVTVCLWIWKERRPEPRRICWCGTRTGSALRGGPGVQNQLAGVVENAKVGLDVQENSCKDCRKGLKDLLTSLAHLICRVIGCK